MVRNLSVELFLIVVKCRELFPESGAEISAGRDVMLTLPAIGEEDDPLLGAAIAAGQDLKPHIIPFVQIVAKHLMSQSPFPSKAQYNLYAKMCTDKYDSLRDRTPTAGSAHVSLLISGPLIVFIADFAQFLIRNI